MFLPIHILYLLGLLICRSAQYSITYIPLLLSNFKTVLSITPNPSGLPTVRITISYSLHPFFTFTLLINVGSIFTFLRWIYRLASQ